MSEAHTISVDITDAFEWPASFPKQVQQTVSLYLPTELKPPATVIFFLPGGGYSRHYFDLRIPANIYPNEDDYSQVDFHLRMGRVVVTVDHLCVGDSTVPSDPFEITQEMLAVATASTVNHILQCLESSETLGLASREEQPKVVGVGQSMGGAITLAAQANHSCFDAIAILAFAVCGTVSVRPSDLPTFDGDKTKSPQPVFDEQLPTMLDLWFRPDVPQAIIDFDTEGGYPLRDQSPLHGSTTIPPCALRFIEPYHLSDAAAQISVPVLLAHGDHDVLRAPATEIMAYENSPKVTHNVIANMGHMHNFASSRAAMWSALETWIERSV